MIFGSDRWPRTEARARNLSIPPNMIVIFWQFGLGLAAMLLRFFESKTFAEWCHRCNRFARKGLLCCRNFWCCPCDTTRKVSVAVRRSITGRLLLPDGTSPPPRQRMFDRKIFGSHQSEPLEGGRAFWRWAAELAIRTLWPRWYWFLLAGQVGFMVREHQVVSMLDGWYIDLVVAHIATWLVIALTAKQVWSFSFVRHKAFAAVSRTLGRTGKNTKINVERRRRIAESLVTERSRPSTVPRWFPYVPPQGRPGGLRLRARFSSEDSGPRRGCCRLSFVTVSDLSTRPPPAINCQRIARSRPTGL